MTKQFREYLQYQPFLVRTDNNPLTYVLTIPNLDAVRHRWVAAMAGYNFEIQYVRGLDNKVADALSRIGGRLDEEDIKELLDQSAIKELLSHAVHYGVPRAKSDDSRVTQEHEGGRRIHHAGANAGGNEEELPEFGRLTVGCRPTG